VPVARLQTDRTPIEIRDPDGRPLAEIIDDRVTGYDEHRQRTGGFREIEVEVRDEGRAGGRLLRAAVGRLRAAGCRAEPPVPKVIRVLGPQASGPPDVVVPRIGADATVDTLLRYATARSVAQILRHDPGVRLGEDPEDVHQFRVATRRLRSDLRTFAPLLDPGPVSELRDRLRLLGAAAGAARDADVLTGRLKASVNLLPDQDAAGVEQLVHRLQNQACEARAALLQKLSSSGYDQLLDTLVGIAAQPPIAAEPPGLASQPAAALATRLIRRPWRAAEPRRGGPVKGFARHPVARRPHSGQAMPLRSRGRRTGLRPPGRPVRRGHRGGPGHPRRSSRHCRRRGMAARHRRCNFPGVRRRGRTDRRGATGTGQVALEVAECLETRNGQETTPLALKGPGHGDATPVPRGSSRMTSAGSLSRRRPWNRGWRSSPSAVHSLNPTWATSLCSTQCTFDLGRPRTGSNGGSGRSSAASTACRLVRVRRSKPVPTLPA
jgi:CHAD domain